MISSAFFDSKFVSSDWGEFEILVGNEVFLSVQLSLWNKMWKDLKISSYLIYIIMRRWHKQKQLTYAINHNCVNGPAKNTFELVLNIIIC